MNKGRIFQIWKTPVPQEERLVAYDIPTFFLEDVSGWVGDELEDDEIEYRKLISALKNTAILREGKVLEFSLDCKKYFKDQFLEFHRVLHRLSETVFLDFSTKGRFEDNMLDLRDTYEPLYGYYVYTEDELITLDSFMRDVKSGGVYYLGGVVEYRY